MPRLSFPPRPPGFHLWAALVWIQLGGFELAAAEPGPTNAAVHPTAVRVSERDASRAEPRFWLENMVVAHGYSWEETAAVMGWTVGETRAKARELGVSAEGGTEAFEAGRMRVRPYPGGRHPRIGFLEGAIDPLRGTKVSIFPPWPDGGYMVLDLPEAIFSQLGLTFLAHTHIPTVWTRQNIALTNVDWVREQDGRLRSEWRLPNGLRFGAGVVPRSDGADCELWLENGTGAELKQLRTQICLLMKGAPGFAAQSADGREFSAPIAVAKAADANRYVLVAFERCGRAWGNPPCPCIHSDPILPDAAPGQRVAVRGRVRFYAGTDLAGAKRRLLDGLESAR